MLAVLRSAWHSLALKGKDFYRASFHWTFPRKVFKAEKHSFFMAISVTLLASYLYCPRKIYLEKVLGFFEPPKAALLIGTIKHQILDLINKAEEKIVTGITESTSFESLEGVYKTEFSKILRETVTQKKEELKKFEVDIPELFKRIWPLILNQSQSRATNVFSFMQANMVYGNELWEKLTPKIHSELKIKSETLGLSGIIDQIEIYEKGYVPIELKSGRAPKEDAWPNHKIQVAAYAMLLEEKFNTEVKEGFIHYLDVNEKRHIPINVFLKEETNELKNKVKALLESADIPDFCDNENKCNACGLKEECFDEKKLEKRQKELIRGKNATKN